MIKTGNKTLELSPFAQIKIMGEQDFHVVITEGDKDYLRKSTNRELTIKIKDNPVKAQVIIGATKHWSYDLEDLNPYENLDPTPFEIPADKRLPPTLEDRMKVFLGQIVAERYGSDSEEMDTFEEANDFEYDDLYDPLTKYEMQTMVEEFPEGNAEPSLDLDVSSETQPEPQEPDVESDPKP